LVQAATKAERVVEPRLLGPVARQQHALHVRHHGGVERLRRQPAGPVALEHARGIVRGDERERQFIGAFQTQEKLQTQVQWLALRHEPFELDLQAGQEAGGVRRDAPVPGRGQRKAQPPARLAHQQVARARGLEGPRGGSGLDPQGEVGRMKRHPRGGADDFPQAGGRVFADGDARFRHGGFFRRQQRKQAQAGGQQEQRDVHGPEPGRAPRAGQGTGAFWPAAPGSRKIRLWRRGIGGA